MRRQLLTLLFALLADAQNISFINPAPAGNNSVYADNPSFAYGSTVDVQWTPNTDTISLVLCQQTQDSGFEYVFQNQKGLSSYNWSIATNKSLEVSRIFFFEIFVTGDTDPITSSHYFNITGDAGSSTTTTNSSVTSATASVPISTATSAAVSASSATAAASGGMAGMGLSTGAKVGIGVAIPLAVIAGLLIGCVAFRRRKNSDGDHETPQVQSSLPMTQDSYHTLDTKQYCDSGPMNTPVELDGSPVYRGPVELQHRPGQ